MANGVLYFKRYSSTPGSWYAGPLAQADSGNA